MYCYFCDFLKFVQSSASYVPIKNPSLTSGTESDDSGRTAKLNNKVVRFNKVAEVIQICDLDYFLFIYFYTFIFEM